MLKEVYEVIVLKEKHDGVLFDPPMVMGVVKLEKFPSVEKIEKSIREFEGDTAKIDKRYKLV